MRAATEGNLPLVMPQGNVVRVLGREVRRGLPGEMMVESSSCCQTRPPCKKSKGKSDEAAEWPPLLTYLITWKNQTSYYNALHAIYFPYCPGSRGVSLLALRTGLGATAILATF